MPSVIRKMIVATLSAGFLFSVALPSALANDHGQAEGTTSQKNIVKQKYSHLFKDLDLTTTPEVEITDAKRKFGIEAKNLQENLKKEKNALSEKFSQKNTSPADVIAQNEQLKSVKNQLSKMKVDGLTAARSVLTPEQVSKITQLKNLIKQP